MNVRIVELSEPLRGNERFLIETKTKEKVKSFFWGLYTKTVLEWEVPQPTHINLSFSNYEDAQTAAKRWQALINPTYHYL